jgi:hypothetical protein
VLARTRGVRAGASIVGSAAAVALIGQVLLPLVNVAARPWFTAAFGATVAFATALVQRRKALQERVAAKAETVACFDDALACFPPPRVRDANAYDLGSIPSRPGTGETGPPPYVARDVDGKLVSALERASLVVVSGDPGAGKSRSALQALTHVRPDARLLVPEGGAALGRLLSLDLSQLLGDEDGGGVLWLDGLDRYLLDLRVDAIDAARHLAIPVVATIRTQTLRDLLSASTEEGRAARRLIARAAVVEVPGQLTDAERTQAALMYPSRPFATGMADAFAVWPCAEDALYAAAGPPPQQASIRLRRDPTAIALVAGLLAGLGALTALAVRDEALQNPPLSEQLADRRDDAADCSQVDQYPAKADDEVHTYVLVVRASRGCDRSDRLQILRVRDGKLRSEYSFQPRNPPGGGFYQLVCRGPDDDSPCAIRGAGSEPAILAGWKDTATGLVVPFVVVPPRRGEKKYKATAIQRERLVDPRAGAARATRVRYGRSVMLTPVGAPAQKRDELKIEGYPMADFAVVPAGDATQLIRGFVWRGTFDNPASVEAYPGQLTLPMPTLKSCTYARRGLGAERFIFRVPARDPGLPALLRQRWRDAVRAGDGVCG